MRWKRFGKTSCLPGGGRTELELAPVSEQGVLVAPGLLAGGPGRTAAPRADAKAPPCASGRMPPKVTRLTACPERAIWPGGSKRTRAACASTGSGGSTRNPKADRGPKCTGWLPGGSGTNSCALGPGGRGSSRTRAASCAGCLCPAARKLAPEGCAARDETALRGKGSPRCAASRARRALRDCGVPGHGTRMRSHRRT